MCDLLVAMSDATHSGCVLFGKNSDRPAGECQVLYRSLGGRHDSSDQVVCTYREIPQASRSLTVIGCRPYWCWGFETGANEAGVVGGNAAIYTRAAYDPRHRQGPGLTGMDLLRLALERAENSAEAVEVITGLLEEHGQWGSAVKGQNHEKGSYENAFLLVDRTEAWVLETSGRRWVAERVGDGVRALSNQLSIRTRWDRASPDLEAAARQAGWSKGEDPFDFALAYSDHEHYARQVSHVRWSRTSQLLERGAPDLEPADVMAILRDHYEDTFLQGPLFNPYLPDLLTLCMHDSPAGFTWGNTATSVVAALDPEQEGPPTLWVAYGPPCSGLYLPIPFSAELPAPVTRTGREPLQVSPPAEVAADSFHPDSLWWRLHRLVELATRKPNRRLHIREHFDPIERDVLGREWSQGDDGWGESGPDLLVETLERVQAALATLEAEWVE